jgi:hypothetical protein
MTDSRAGFESWLTGYVVQHPLLASAVKVLPGVTVHDLVAAVAEEAWEAAQRVVPVPQPVERVEQQPVPVAAPLHLVAPPPAPVRRARGWTAEQKAAAAERMRQRWAEGRGAPYRRTMTDAELDAVATRAKSRKTT